MLALLVAASALSELDEAHRAFVAAPESGKVAAQVRLAQLYAGKGMRANAKFFFERALKVEPRNEEAKAGLAAIPALPPPQAEAQLGSLAQRLFGSGQLDLGLRADLARLTSLAARDESVESPAAAREALNRASLLLLASGLDAHPVAVARQLLAGGAAGCGVPCVPPTLLTHRGETHGVSMAEARSFIGCCLATDKTLERLLTTRKASVTEANDFGYTPLHFAAMADQPALALALVARGANVSAQTTFGQTPLHLAAQRNATAAIEALLRDETVRAVAAVRDASKRTAAKVACENGFNAAAEMLDTSTECRPHRLTLGDQPHMLEACKFDVRRPDEVTAPQLLEYAVMGKPLLIKGGAASLGEWFAPKRWTVEKLVERAGDAVVEVADVPGGGAPPTATKLADFLRGGEESSRAAVSQLFHVWQEPAMGFHLPEDSYLDPEITAMRPDRVLMTLTPNGGGLPMRAGHALVDVLVRGAKTWLLQAPSEATHSRMHPADATASAPWPYDAETLFSCEQEAGDVFLVPDMWAHASLSHEPSVSIAVHPEVGANEFSFSR